MKEVKNWTKPNERAHITDNAIYNTPQVKSAGLRSMFFSLIKAATGTSNIETKEVIAAKKTSKKKILATKLAPKYPMLVCSSKKICGKKEKIILIDDSLNSSVLMFGLKEKIAGKIINPAVNATAVSVSATSFAEPGISAFLSIYEP